MLGESRMEGSTNRTSEAKNTRRMRNRGNNDSAVPPTRNPVSEKLTSTTYQTESTDPHLRGTLKRLTAQQVANIECDKINTSFELILKTDDGADKGRIHELDQGIEEAAFYDLPELLEENTRLRHLLSQLADRVQVLEKRLSGLGWRLD